MTRSRFAPPDADAADGEEVVDQNGQESEEVETLREEQFWHCLQERFGLIDYNLLPEANDLWEDFMKVEVPVGQAPDAGQIVQRA